MFSSIPLSPSLGSVSFRLFELTLAPFKGP